MAYAVIELLTLNFALNPPFRQTLVMRPPFFSSSLVYSLRGALAWWLFCNFGFVRLACANCKCATKSVGKFFLLFQ